MISPPSPIELAREADFALGGAAVRPALRLFAANGAEEAVEPRVMQVLVALSRRAGEVVGRDELVALCWEGRVIGDDAIQRAVAKVRKLGEASGAFAIETIPKVGYRIRPSGFHSPESCAAASASELTNLPRRLEHLIGREDDMARVAAILGEADLVTIAGAGGVGKTRLALETGHSELGRHADGVWLVELAPVSDPAILPHAIARALGIQLSGASNPTNALLEQLKHARALLILDNCEHVIDAAAGLAEALLQQAPRLKLLATSQEPLGIEGERVFRLRSLNETDAAQLFAARAKAADANFAVTPQNAKAISAICSRLDGIPLAIEMAAARAPTLGCDDLLARLDDRFRVLTGGRRTALPRQRTLHATLEWSHSLLSETEAAVFRRLGAFVGGFSAAAASDVAADERTDDAAVLDTLASLVAKSLVAPGDEHGRLRYRLLETTRAFAQEKLAEAGETRTIQRRHAIHFAMALEPAHREFYYISDETYLTRYGADIGNFTRALEWVLSDGDSELFARLVANSGIAFARDLIRDESTGWTDRAVERLDADAAPAHVRRQLLAMQAMQHALVYRGSAFALVEHNLRAVSDAEDEITTLFSVLWAKAFCLIEKGRIDAAKPCIERILRIAGATPSRISVTADYLRCLVLWSKRGAADARPCFDAVLAKCRSIGHQILQRVVVIEGSSSVAPQDEADVAISGLRTLLAEIDSSDPNGPYLKCLCEARLMMLLGLRGGADDIVEARQIAKAATRVPSRFTDYRYTLALACMAHGAGRHEDAARMAGCADALRHELEAHFWFGNVFADIRAALQCIMPENEIARLWSAGADMAVEEAFRITSDDA